jgi:hypothetical protein
VIANDQAETMQHVLQHFRSLLSLPTDRAAELGDEPLAFVRAHGIRRARAGVPLIAVLQAYRTGHKSFWSAMCDMINRFCVNTEDGLRVTMLLSDYGIEYVDLISATVTDAYLSEETQLALQRTRLSVAVVDDLLQGRLPSSDEALALCRLQNVGGAAPMAVLVARLTPQGGPFSAQLRAALARAIEQALPQSAFGGLVELRQDEVVAVISGERPAARAAQAIRESGAVALGGPHLRIGIGLDVNHVASLPRSHSEARTAIALLGGERPVAYLGEAGVDTYLLHVADETAHRLAPPWVGEIADDVHWRTLRAFADASLNVKACANILKVHNNTIYHRLNRIRKLTGIDPRTYTGLNHLLTALSVSASDRRPAP